MAMKDCFGTGMQWWVPVKQGITNAEKQRECYECPDFDMCSKAHLVHSNRHLVEIILHQVPKATKPGPVPASPHASGVAKAKK